MSKMLVDFGADEHVCPQQFVAGALLGPVRGGPLYDAGARDQALVGMRLFRSFEPVSVPPCPGVHVRR